MNLLKIEISKDGAAACETQTAGQLGEGNITRLKFIVPYEYREYYKYIDILKGNGEKTQTVVGDTESEIFYFNIPHSLTKYRELFIQLVMKKEDKIFKSKMIALHFDGSISATQYLEENYQDTIEFIMENKADKNDIKSLESRLLLKAGKSELYEINEAVARNLSENQEKNDIRFEGLEVITDSLRDKKVDKIYGKGLSSNDYSDEEKEKLSKLPSKDELVSMLGEKASVIRYNLNDGSYPLDDIQENGMYILVENDGGMHSIYTFYVWWEFGILSQILINQYGMRAERTLNDGVWSQWKTISVPFTFDNYQKFLSLQNQVGDFDLALDELHNYAQALISGGEG